MYDWFYFFIELYSVLNATYVSQTIEDFLVCVLDVFLFNCVYSLYKSQIKAGRQA